MKVSVCRGCRLHFHASLVAYLFLNEVWTLNFEARLSVQCDSVSVLVSYTWLPIPGYLYLVTFKGTAFSILQFFQSREAHLIVKQLSGSHYFCLFIHQWKPVIRLSL